MSCKYEGPSPGEHPEYSLGLAFSLLCCKILFIPEVGLHLFKVHALDGGERVFGDWWGQVCSGLFCSGGMNFGDVLGAIDSVSSSMELAFVTLVLWFSAVLDAVAILSAIEALVALGWSALASSSGSFLWLLVLW